jgi:membrane protease YdiL (CAAX protease family)
VISDAKCESMIMRKYWLNLPKGFKTNFLLGSFFAIILIKWAVQLFYRIEWPQWLTMLFVLIMFLIVFILITVEKFHLDEYHVDKFSIYIIIVFGGFLRPIRTEEPLFTLALTISFTLMGVILIVYSLKKKIILTTPPHLIYWIVISLLISYLEYLFVENLLIPSAINQSHISFLNSLYTVDYELSNVVISEELFFRGFLWGGLRNGGYKNVNILLVQAFLFMVAHINFNQLRTITAFLLVFIQGIIYGIFAWKSKSILPGIIIHTFHNTLFITRLF